MKYALAEWPGHPKPLLAGYQPDVRPCGKRLYINQKRYDIIIQNETGVRYTLSVPPAFISDGASVPRLAWTASGLTPDGLIRAAALVHDFIYTVKGKVMCQKHTDGVVYQLSLDRKSADEIFLDLMLAATASSARSKLAFRAVRVFGPRW